MQFTIKIFNGKQLLILHQYIQKTHQNCLDDDETGTGSLGYWTYYWMNKDGLSSKS